MFKFFFGFLFFPFILLKWVFKFIFYFFILSVIIIFGDDCHNHGRHWHNHW